MNRVSPDNAVTGKMGYSTFDKPKEWKLGFYRQLDLLVTVLAALLVFASCTFRGGLPVKISSLIAALVFLAGLRFGRRIAEVLRFFG